MGSIGWLVPTSGYSATETDRRTAILARLTPPGVRVEVLTPSASPAFLDAAADFSAVQQSAAAFIRSIDPTEYPVIVSAGAIDPGLADLRASTAATVIGPAESAFFLAAAMGRRVGIVTVDEHAVGAARTMLALTRPRAEVVSIRHIGFPVRTISRRIDDGEPIDDVEAAILRESRAAIGDGAQAIQLGAMTLATLGVADRLREQLGVPVLDPIRISMAVAVECLAAGRAAQRELSAS